MSDEQTLKVGADSFLGLFPVNWGIEAGDRFEASYQQFWGSGIDVELTEHNSTEDVAASGQISKDEFEAKLAVEESQPNLVEWAGSAKEPFTPSEEILLKEHSAIWRVSVEAKNNPVQKARDFARLSVPLVQMGSPGVFLIGSAMLHSSTFVKQITRQLERPDAVANFFVGANDNGDWMWTRGLTAFGWPELETPINKGMNAAYFCLMDVASGILERKDPYPIGARLTVGPNRFRLEEGRKSPDDAESEVSGMFGTLTVTPV